ncbi:MAG: hypothetical protein M3X11_02130 [Acidobacteriota bacterium]|nr:hypothetical protein [Acidobacteriota bacterium]
MDHFLLNEAIALGAEYLDQMVLNEVELTGSAARLSGERPALGNKPVRVNARLLIDASGPNGFLSRKLNLAGRGFDGYPPTQSLFSHFINVHRCDEMPDYEVSGAPAYPPPLSTPLSNG